MEDGDFSSNGRVSNPPQSPSCGHAGENSLPEPSPRPSFIPLAPNYLPETLDFSSLNLNAGDRSYLPSSSSLPGSSQSDGHRGLPRRTYAIGSNRPSDQNLLGNGVGDCSWLSQVDVLRFPVESSPLSPGRNNGFSYRSFAPSRGMITYGMNTDASCQVPKLTCLRGKVVALAMNHANSKILQDSIGAAGSYSEIDEVLPEFTNNIGYLMVSPFGNSVVQKLIEKSNDSQRNSITLALSCNPNQLYEVCRSAHGTRVVQRLLESLNYRSIATIVEALSPFTVPLSKDANGHHVIQHCLKNFHDVFILKITCQVARKCIELAMDKSGCCVLQLCIDRSSGHVGNFIIRSIITNAVCLSEDCFGNYVVQHLLEMKVPDVNTRILESLKGNFMALSMNKYGSNVVEKCLNVPDDLRVSMIIRELITHPKVAMLFVDQYGNYVVQSALAVSKGVIRNILVDTINSYVPMMKSNIYGKKILSSLQKKKILSTPSI